MNRILHIFTVLVATTAWAWGGTCAGAALACDKPVAVCETDAPSSFGLVRNGAVASVFVDPDADSALIHVAEAFAADLQKVSGQKGARISRVEDAKGEVVIIGVAGKSRTLESLVRAGKISFKDLKGQWEAYKQIVVDNPFPNVSRALVIVGVDRRGAVFGTYDLSEKMGVSPWNWWADVPTLPKKNVFVVVGERVDAPKVRYRGFFINDEDPALKGWATKRFGGLNSEMYANVFELTLRLKGNYVWPAMWGKAFNVDDPENMVVADEMGVVMGTSHHEPMMRAQKEWHLETDKGVTGGKWDYAQNPDNLRTFWRGGIGRMMSKPGKGGYESLVTIGMRGDGDEPMSEGTATDLLESVVRAQRKIIADVTRKPARETPQVWALYKEVQQYYEHGMKVPDDVILLFADDNWGQIRRLPIAGKDSLTRSGGYGVYYHYDYVGVPRNYKWLNTNQVEKVWQQMDLAYSRGARSLWIVNVGDIKPMEYPLQFFLKMAWDPESMTPEALKAYPEQWAAATFGSASAKDIGAIVTEYGRLSSLRKPELVNQDSFPLGEGAGPVLNGGAFGDIVADWQALAAKVDAVKATLSSDQQSAYFQLVEWPVRAVGNLYETYYAAAWNKRLASRNDPRANYFADWVERAFQRDRELTDRYHSLNGGKWDGMVNQVHMSYVIWNDPPQQSMPNITRVAGEAPADTLSPAPRFASRGEAKAASGPEIILDVAKFARQTSGKGIQWTVLPELGRYGSALISYPQGRPATTKQDAISVEYDVDFTKAGNVSVGLQLVPTLDTSNNGGVYVGVSIDDGPVQVLISRLQATGGGANTPGEKAWYQAVSNNSETLWAQFADVTAGKHAIRIWRLDDNVILQRITVTPAR